MFDRDLKTNKYIPQSFELCNQTESSFSASSGDSDVRGLAQMVAHLGKSNFMSEIQCDEPKHECVNIIPFYLQDKEQKDNVDCKPKKVENNSDIDIVSEYDEVQKFIKRRSFDFAINSAVKESKSETEIERSEKRNNMTCKKEDSEQLETDLFNY